MITKIFVIDCSSIYININRLIDIDCHRLSRPRWNSLGNSSFSVHITMNPYIFRSWIWRQVRTAAFLVSTIDSSKSKKPTKGSFFAGSVETILLYLHLPGIKLLFKNTNEETEVWNWSLYALAQLTNRRLEKIPLTFLWSQNFLLSVVACRSRCSIASPTHDWCYIG